MCCFQENKDRNRKVGDAEPVPETADVLLPGEQGSKLGDGAGKVVHLPRPMCCFQENKDRNLFWISTAGIDREADVLLPGEQGSKPIRMTFWA